MFEASGKSWDDISSLDDDRLYDLFYPDKFKYKIRYAPVDYSYVHKELKKTGVTLKLLWEEYSDKCISEGVKSCSYITYTKNYNKYTADKNYTSHVEHKPGIEIEVDWSGPTMSYVDSETGEIIFPDTLIACSNAKFQVSCRFTFFIIITCTIFAAAKRHYSSFTVSNNFDILIL